MDGRVKCLIHFQIASCCFSVVSFLFQFILFSLTLDWEEETETARGWQKLSFFIVPVQFYSPTFLHLTVAGRNAITTKKARMEAAPGTTEKT